ncbi:MAG: hypothetical protein NC400_05410 [Clostridium sp.]|nr:hypothetical protein [Clostridium sp.]
MHATLNLQALKQKKGKIVSSQETLKDVKPIAWGDEVLKHGKKITVAKLEDRGN